MEQEIVYQEFDEAGFNFTKVDPNEILLYLNLEECSIVRKKDVVPQDKQTSSKMATNSQQQTEKGESAEIEAESVTPLVINPSPFCKNHCLLPVFCKEKLPQVISSEILLYILPLFDMSQRQTFR